MCRLWSCLRFIAITLILGLGTVACPKPAAASHFRYGHLTWRMTNQATNAVEFTLTCGFRRGATPQEPTPYPGTAPDGLLAVGDIFQETIGGTFLDFGDGTFDAGPNFSGLTFICVAIDPVRNYVVARALDPATRRDRITHSYRFANDPRGGPTGNGGPWIPNISSCCRIRGLLNSPGSNSITYQVLTEVDLTLSGSSPVSSLPPIIPVRQSGATIQVPGLDFEQSTLRYRLSDPFEASQFGEFPQPPGVTIDPQTGVFTIPAGLTAGLWATQITIEKYSQSGLKLGQSAVDFIFDVRAQVTTQAPQFDRPPTPADGITITAPVGRRLSYTVQASDPDGGFVTLNTTGAPLGAAQGPSLPRKSRPVASTLVWTPTTADIGAYTVVYTAEDDFGNFVQTVVNIRVILPIIIREPNGGEAYLIGSNVPLTWTSTGGPRGQGVRIELSRDGGLTFPEVIAANVPDTGSYSWLATAPFTKEARFRITNVADPADFDVSDANFTVTDGRSVTLCTQSTRQIPDNEPEWTEIPLTFNSLQLIRGARVSVDITHPYPADLQIQLQHPDGTTVLLRDLVGVGTQNVHETYGAGLAYTLPVQSLGILNGKRSQGIWRLRVRDLHPGDVGQITQWCLTIIGPPPGGFVVTSPNGGEAWPVGSTQTITWTLTNVTGDARVQLSRDGGQTFATLATVPASNRSYRYTVTGPETSQARVRIVSATETAIFDDSNADFTIRVASLEVLQPNGGERLTTGEPYTIKWVSVPAGGTVRIELSRDGGRTFGTLIAASAPDSGSFVWTPTAGLNTSQARIRISSNSGIARTDTSNADFTITTTRLTVVAPNGGEVIFAYNPFTIRWESDGVSGNVKIELLRRGVWETLASNAPNTGTFAKSFTGPSALDGRIRITSLSNPRITDTSDRAFEIRLPSITVTSPVGGVRWATGTTQTITWTQRGVPGNVDILLSRDGGVSFTTLFLDTPNDGSQSWRVVGPASNRCRITVRAHSRSVPVSGFNTTLFSITPPPSIRANVPNDGRALVVGRSYALTWTSTAVVGPVKIEISRNGGPFTSIFDSTANDGSQAWVATGPPTDSARIKVSSVAAPTVSGTSAPFRIVVPTLTVLAPNGAERWAIGSQHAITWRPTGLGGNVRIEITRNNTTTWQTLFSSVPDNGLINWTVTGPASGVCRIRITSLSAPSATDVSDGLFTVFAP